jgi:DNA-binding CsgD family transcriptional regulator
MALRLPPHQPGHPNADTSLQHSRRVPRRHRRRRHGNPEGHTAEVAALLRTLGGRCEKPSWLWWSGVAPANGEARYRSALRLAGAADAVARRDGHQLHEQLCRQLQPWLERSQAEAGSAKADHLGVEGSQLSSDELMDEALGEADHGSTPLSSRELEVADLVGEGLTNREIAQRLIISTRTVESHVDHIKAKLGFGRRARIVAWALDRVSGNGASTSTNPRIYG